MGERYPVTAAELSTRSVVSVGSWGRDRIKHLMNYGEDAVWRPVKEAHEVMADAANTVSASQAVLDAAKRVMEAHDEVNAWMALGWPARTLVAEPNRQAATSAFAALRAAVAKAEGVG